MFFLGFDPFWSYVQSKTYSTYLFFNEIIDFSCHI